MSKEAGKKNWFVCFSGNCKLEGPVLVLLYTI